MRLATLMAGLLALVLVGPALAQEPTADAGDPEPVPGLAATLTSEPTEVEVGEPMVWTLAVTHPSDLTPVLPGDDLGLGPHWVVLEELGTTTSVEPDGDARVTRKRWRVLGLASAKAMPAMTIAFGEEESALTVITAEAPLVVRTVLGLGEQFARPTRGFRDPEPVDSTGFPWWAVGAAVPVLLAIVWWLAMRRRAATAEPEPDPLEQLDDLARHLPDDPREIQSLHYALTELVREAADRRLGRERFGATDDEWLEEVRRDRRMEAETVEQLEAVLAAARDVKYAGATPTRWKVEETLAAARAAVERVRQPSGGEA